MKKLLVSVMMLWAGVAWGEELDLCDVCAYLHEEEQEVIAEATEKREAYGIDNTGFLFDIGYGAALSRVQYELGCSAKCEVKP